MNRIVLLAASLALAACTGRSPWAAGSAKSPEDRRVAVVPAAPAPAAVPAAPEVEPPAVPVVETPVAPPIAPPVAPPAEPPAVATAPATEPSAPQPVAKAGPRYSWQKKTEEEAASPAAQVKTGAPDDATKCRILAVQPEHGLIVFATKEKPADGSTLQLTKGDRAVLIRVIRSDDTSTIADIVSGQDLSKMPAFELLEEVLCGAPADLPVQ